MLPSDVQVVVLERGGLRVANVRLARFIDENAAARRHALRPAETEHPAGHVVHVNAHVANDAVAIFHECSPPAAVRKPVVGPQWRRSAPHFVIQEFRDRLQRRVAVVSHVVIATDIDLADLAEQAGFDDVLLGVDQMRRAAALRAHLHDAVVLASRGEHRFALEHVATDRLLHVHVGAGLDSRNHRQRVPMVRRADQHDIEVLILEHLAIVAKQSRRFL